MGWFKNQAIFGSLNQLATGRDDALEKLQLAIATGGDVDALGWGHGLTPLMRASQLAAQLPEGSDLMTAITVLCNAGADPLKKDKGGRANAFEYARELGLHGIVHRLELQAKHNETMVPLRKAGFRI